MTGNQQQEHLMIKGVHTMFYSSQASELRDFIKNKLQLPAAGIADVGYGLATQFEMPGGVKVELYQPAYK